MCSQDHIIFKIGMSNIFNINDVMGKTKLNKSGIDFGLHKDLLMKCLKFINDNEISSIPEIIKLMKLYGLKSGDIIKLFLSFKDEYNSNQIDQINWMNNRSFRQINFFLKNFVAARILYQYGDHFLKFLQNFDCKNLIKKPEFYQKMIEMTQSLKTQQKCIISNMNPIEHDDKNDSICDIDGNDSICNHFIGDNESDFDINWYDDDIDQLSY